MGFQCSRTAVMGYSWHRWVCHNGLLCPCAGERCVTQRDSTGATAAPMAQPDTRSLFITYLFFIIVLSARFPAVTELNAKSLCSLISTKRVCWVWAVAAVRDLGYRCRDTVCSQPESLAPSLGSTSLGQWVHRAETFRLLFAA